MKVRGHLDVKQTITQAGQPVDGAAAAGAEFYLTVKHSDDSASFTGINVIAVEVANFYLKQNDPNTDEVTINLRGEGGVGPAGPTGPTGPQGPAGPGFYLTAKQSDDLQSFSGVNVANSSQ